MYRNATFASPPACQLASPPACELASRQTASLPACQLASFVSLLLASLPARQPAILQGRPHASLQACNLPACKQSASSQACQIASLPACETCETCESTTRRCGDTSISLKCEPFCETFLRKRFYDFRKGIAQVPCGTHYNIRILKLH